ncbi:hypothetical protein HY988_06050 [Candidatus Micrarchaeota archaeon]|nr:hypothetical protein [Candidatus Micrarchaeota archaeon]
MEITRRSSLHKEVVRWEIQTEDRVLIPLFLAPAEGRKVTGLDIATVKDHFRFFGLMAEDARKTDNGPLRNSAAFQFLANIEGFARGRVAELEGAALAQGYSVCQLNPILLTELTAGSGLRFELSRHGRKNSAYVEIAPPTDPLVLGLVKLDGPEAGLMSPFIISFNWIVSKRAEGRFAAMHDFLGRNPTFSQLMESQSPLRFI